MFTSFNSHEVSLLISVLRYANTCTDKFPREAREYLSQMAQRLQDELARVETKSQQEHNAARPIMPGDGTLPVQEVKLAPLDPKDCEGLPVVEELDRPIPDWEGVREYVVTWTIDLDATSPEAAAERAREIQMDPYNIATFYTVKSRGGVEPFMVELEPTPQSTPVERFIGKHPALGAPYDPEAQRCVIMKGNPVDGFSTVGPFNSREDAIAYGDSVDSEWWVIDLDAPDEC